MKIKKNGQVITLTESDLSRIVKKIINEQTDKELIELMKGVYKKYAGGPSLSGKGEYKMDSNKLKDIPEKIWVSKVLPGFPEKGGIRDIVNDIKMDSNKLKDVPEEIWVSKVLPGFPEKGGMRDIVNDMWRTANGKSPYLPQKYDEDVKKVQEYFNSTGDLGDGKKYGKLKENGIYDDNTHWQVNNWLSNQIDNSFWKEHKHSFKK